MASSLPSASTASRLSSVVVAGPAPSRQAYVTSPGNVNDGWSAPPAPRSITTRVATNPVISPNGVQAGFTAYVTPQAAPAQRSSGGGFNLLNFLFGGGSMASGTQQQQPFFGLTQQGMYQGFQAASMFDAGAPYRALPATVARASEDVTSAAGAFVRQQQQIMSDQQAQGAAMVASARRTAQELSRPFAINLDPNLFRLQPAQVLGTGQAERDSASRLPIILGGAALAFLAWKFRHKLTRRTKSVRPFPSED